jgi:hypothetical protein
MSNYNWCHGPNCHTYTTQSRVRGSGDNKVLRTIRIKENEWNKDHAFKYFCNQNCLYGFINKHLEELIKIAPRREPLETPIKVEKEKYESYRYRFTDDGHRREPYQATRTTINKVDNVEG